MKKLFLAIFFFIQIQQLSAQTSKADAFIDNFTKRNNFNGVVLIKQNGKTSYKQSFGFANLSFKIPNTIETKFKVASITKAFTAVLILQLYEQGKIDLNKTITTYLTDYKGVGGNKVTIKQLLNMTSGLHNMDAGVSFESALKNGIPQYQRPFTADELLIKYCSDSLVAEPGKEFDYNNADFIILGKIIERVSGKSFEQNLQEKILYPLHMTNSGLLKQEVIVDKLADTYFYRDDLKTLVNDLPVYWGNWYAAGAMYANVDDILAFSDALFGAKLLKRETLNQMFTSGLGEYGYGVWVYKDYEIGQKKYTIIKRPGSIMGAQAMLFHVLEEGSTIIILTNTGNVSLDEFAADIAKQIIN
ncbi:beta-lactamase family protein [Solitalea sp. MAHUQ-68]|uniref:Beta-lactamase family protein n=1 Tax=Solitalea agri TaxID=2953739 RepID=A0A9X2F5H4_9SPHI|nr:serine hydrolase domain-containing protein [Solitalea agri]MCO4294615.1 beta-lactamase family protein [Solitalea agri]